MSEHFRYVTHVSCLRIKDQLQKLVLLGTVTTNAVITLVFYGDRGGGGGSENRIMTCRIKEVLASFHHYQYIK